MKIFYLKKDETLKKISLQELVKFSDGRLYRNEEKYVEHLLGLYLVKTVASKFYNIKDTAIVYDGKKPRFKNGKINFSISHSDNIVVAVFCEHNIGIDIEKTVMRDFQKLAKRYNITPSKEDFYRFWTIYEAEIKLGKPCIWRYSSFLDTEYLISCVSDTEISSNIELIEL